MANATIDESTARFEKIWAEAQAQISTEPAVTSSAMDMMDYYMPQFIAAKLGDLADLCLAEKMIDKIGHAELRLSADTQEKHFSAMNQEQLKKLVLTMGE